MNSVNSYNTIQRFENHWRDVFERNAYTHGNGTLPLNWTAAHHALPAAKYAGHVGPAGGYKDLLSGGDFKDETGQYSIVGPAIVAGIIVALLYSRA